MMGSLMFLLEGWMRHDVGWKYSHDDKDHLEIGCQRQRYIELC